ncbi:hypothetical protein JCM11251_001154 [Rhodosporidiobolus azoricus]
MNVRKAASSVPSTISRQLKAGFLKNPPPSFYPLLAHPPPPSLVRSFPARDEQDVPRSARRSTFSPSTSKQPRSLYQQAKDKLDAGIRLTAAEDAALLDPSPAPSPAHGRQTRRKPPRAANTRRPKPLPIVFAEDAIRKRFFADHPFEAYRPVSLVEGEKVRESDGPQGKEWTELSQRSVVPTAEDCISYIHNLTTSHSLPLTQAYPHGIAQFRTLRAEHETATLAARQQASSFGAIFFGEIEKTVAVEEKILDQWVGAREVQARFAAGTGAAAGAAAAGPVAVQGVEGVWAPAEARPAHVLGGEEESLFSGGVEYLQAFAKSSSAPSAAIAVGDGKLVGVEA